jgi:multiple sugar transport system permease protein
LARAAQHPFFLAPWLIGFTVFTLIPMGVSLYYSFTSYDLGTPPQWIGLNNWIALLHDPVAWDSLWNSLYYSLGSVPLQLIVALGIALLLNVKGVPGRGVLRTVFYLPTMVPTVAASIIWIALLNPYGGLINDALRFIHVPQPLWLQSTTWAMPGLILMSVWGIGTTVIIYLAGLQDIPRFLYEQAMMDGAGTWRSFVNVTLPMLSPIVLFNGIINLVWSMQTFTQPYLMTKGGPMNATMLYPLDVFQNAFSYLDIGYASSLAWLLFVVILALTLFAFWVSRRVVFYNN